MKIKLISLLFVLILTSCGNMTKNISKKSTALIKGGSVGEVSWEEPLVFQRFSWYSELNLVFDVFATRMEQDSPYWAWFSEWESKRLKQCKAVYVVLTFSLNSDYISHSMFYKQVLSDDLSSLVTNDFDRALANHPDYNKFFLSQYKKRTLCASREISDIAIEFPNYTTRVLVH